jgi:hypothetical protein
MMLATVNHVRLLAVRAGVVGVVVLPLVFGALALQHPIAGHDLLGTMISFASIVATPAMFVVGAMMVVSEFVGSRVKRAALRDGVIVAADGPRIPWPPEGYGSSSSV